MFCFLCILSLWMIQYLFVQKVKCKQSLFVLKISYSFAQIISLATTWQLKKVLENRLTSSASNGSSTWFLFQRLWEPTMRPRPPPAPPSPASWPPPPSASSPSAWGSSRYWLDKFWLERFLWTNSNLCCRLTVSPLSIQHRLPKRFFTSLPLSVNTIKDFWQILTHYQNQG